MVAEQRENLWLVIASPLIWALHFLLSYGTAAIWCAKFAGPERSFLTARLIIASYTLVALGAITAVGYAAAKRHALRGVRERTGDSDADRHRFLGFASLLLSGLCAVAVSYASLAIALIGTCH